MSRRAVLLRCLRAASLMLLCTALVVPGVALAQGVQNPIGCDELTQCILSVINYVLGLAGVLALAAIVYGGFLYITAAGNQDRIEAGKHAIFYSIVGLVVIALSYAILTFVFTALRGGTIVEPRQGQTIIEPR